MKNTRFRNIKTAFGAAFATLLISGLSSCGKEDPNSPGVEFFPDMYRSPSLEYYQTHFIDGDTMMNAKQPVAGTIARGYIPYTYPNTPEGYEAAGTSLKSPLPRAQQAQWENEGEELYGKFCVHCHGANGDGDGKVGQKLPGAPPAYSGALKDLPEGKIYHSITFGKGLMGAHNSLVNDLERWKLVAYVQKLQGKGSETASADSTQAAAAPTATAGTTESKVSNEAEKK